jgi:hypothetical protein
VDSALKLDADYMFFKDIPDIREKYYAAHKNENLIHSDQFILNPVAEKAKKYYLLINEMVWQEANRMYKE